MSKMKPEMTNKALHRKIAFSFAFFVLGNSLYGRDSVH